MNSNKMTMTTQPENLLAKKTFITRCIAFFIISIGVFVLFCWHNPDVFIEIYANVIVMAYNTAICIILLGISLIAVTYNNHWLIRACGLFILLLSSLTLIEFIF